MSLLKAFTAAAAIVLLAAAAAYFVPSQVGAL